MRIGPPKYCRTGFVFFAVAMDVAGQLNLRSVARFTDVLRSVLCHLMVTGGDALPLSKGRVREILRLLTSAAV